MITIKIQSGEKMNLRVKKTKEYIKLALFQISKTKGINHVTIQDIIHAAEINRATFYYHYKDKQDLLEQIQEETLEGLVQDLQLQSVTTIENIIYPPILASFKHVKKNSETYQFLLGPDGISDFNWRMLGIIRYSIRNNIIQLNKHNLTVLVDETFLTDFIAGALVSTLMAWVDNGFIQHPETLAHEISCLLANGMNSGECIRKVDTVRPDLQIN